MAFKIPRVNFLKSGHFENLRQFLSFGKNFFPDSNPTITSYNASTKWPQNLPNIHKHTKWPQNLPNLHKHTRYVCRIKMKYAQPGSMPTFKAFQNVPNLGFWYAQIPSGNPGWNWPPHPHFGGHCRVGPCALSIAEMNLYQIFIEYVGNVNRFM
jgi:hypothetical protein